MTFTRPTLIQLAYLTANAQQDERREYAAIHGNFYPDGWAIELAELCRSGPSHVLCTKSGLPYFAGGANYQTGTTLSTWSVGTNLLREHVIEATRQTRRFLKALFDSGASRIQIMAMGERTAACRWYGALGAHLEATLEGYGVKGENFSLFAILRSK